jgi:hypothetical protein
MCAHGVGGGGLDMTHCDGNVQEDICVHTGWMNRWAVGWLVGWLGGGGSVERTSHVDTNVQQVVGWLVG